MHPKNSAASPQSPHSSHQPSPNQGGSSDAAEPTLNASFITSVTRKSPSSSNALNASPQHHSAALHRAQASVQIVSSSPHSQNMTTSSVPSRYPIRSALEDNRYSAFQPPVSFKSPVIDFTPNPAQLQYNPQFLFSNLHSSAAAAISNNVDGILVGARNSDMPSLVHRPLSDLRYFGIPVDLSASNSTQPTAAEQDKVFPSHHVPHEHCEQLTVYRPECMRLIHDMLRSLHDASEYEQAQADSTAKTYPTGQDPKSLLIAKISEFKPELDPFFLIALWRASPAPAPRKSPIPPKRSDAPRITLALDLDETLAHCTVKAPSPPQQCSCSFNVCFSGQKYVVYAHLRPHLDYFLRQVSQWFEVVVFTASQKSYAASLLNIIDPLNEFITHRVFRDSCVSHQTNYLKDLSILGRPLEHVIIVDNSFQAFTYQLDNGIPIDSWFDLADDVQLLNIIPLLRFLKDVDDVRPYLRDLFHLRELINALPQDFQEHASHTAQ